MNTTHNTWKHSLYLDALGSASVIAASVLIFLFVAVTAIVDVTPSTSPVAEVCPATRVAAIDYADQRPGAPRQPAGTACA